jgi:hypothetical protein
MRSRHLAAISLLAGLAGLALAAGACSDDDLRDQHHGTDAGFGYKLPDGGPDAAGARRDGASETDVTGDGGAGDGGASVDGTGDGGAQG